MKLTFKTKADLIKALEAKRKVAKRLDAEAKRNRRSETNASDKLFRQRLREALKWSPEEVRRQRYGVSLEYSEKPASGCADSWVSRLDAQLAHLAITGQVRFVVQEGGTTAELWKLLTMGFPGVKTACEA